MMEKLRKSAKRNKWKCLIIIFSVNEGMNECVLQGRSAHKGHLVQSINEYNGEKDKP